MGHLPKLIEDLALILLVAGIVVLVFRRIRQPLVLGYIIAGLLVGPNLNLFSTVVDSENVESLAEIGVIFLLFSLGLEFSFKKLMHVGGSASITAFVDITLITLGGYFVGQWLGWSNMDSLFLGGMLASSSTTIIIRAFDELGVKTRNFARTVFGVLVVEDIVVILLMVLLSTIAVTKEFEGGEILFMVGKLVFFLVLWFLLGIYLLPTFLRRVKEYLDDEILLILSMGLCLGMVLLATSVGFSAELGAFVMGSLIAETVLAEKVERILKSVKDLFGAVFFVSIGMLIDPNAMLTYAFPIFVVTLLIAFGKTFSVSLGALISGQPLKQSLQVGMSMGQIGEFAFIVATLGLSLGVISDFLFPIAVGVSAITTFTTPYFIKFSEPFHQWLVKIIPERLLDKINNYSSSTQSIHSEGDWKTVLREYLHILLVNGVIIIALFLLMSKFVIPYIHEYLHDNTLRLLVGNILPLLIISPFLWAFMAKRPHSFAYKELWLKKKYNRGPLFVLEMMRVIFGILIIGFFLNRFASTTLSFLITIPIAVVLLFLFSKRMNRLYQKFEKHFISNYNARANAHKKEQLLASEDVKKHLSAWDIHVVEMEVQPLAVFTGKTLCELAWREKYGVNIAYVKRGDKIVNTQLKDQMLFPHDRVGIIATDEQIQAFKPVFEHSERLPQNLIELEDIKLDSVIVNSHSCKIKGMTIKQSRINEMIKGFVVAIRRGEERILNPKSSEILQEDDILWIVGDRKKIDEINHRNRANKSL